MQQFLQKYGRALDLSGAFLFGLIGAYLAYRGLHLWALGFWLGALGLFLSWRAWNAPDAVELAFNRTMSAIMSLLSLATIILAATLRVLA